MTLADLLSTPMASRWRSLTAADKEAIGTKVLAWALGELVADDDGTDTSEADRNRAQSIADDAFSAVLPAVMAAIPDVVWFWPAGTRYLVLDRHEQVVGEITDAEPTCGYLTAYRFVQNGSEAAHGLEPGPVVNGLPAECLLAPVQHIITAGGCWRAVPPEPIARAA